MRKGYNVQSVRAAGPYSHAVDADGMVFLSGQTPKIPNSTDIKFGDITAQTKQCFLNLFEVLKEVGLTPDDVVKVNVFLTDINSFAEMNAVYETQFTKPYPARTTIGVLALPLGAEVEIEMIAKRP